MRTVMLLALLLPWLAVMLCRKPFQGLFNLVLWVAGALTLPWGFGVGFVLLAVVHAWFVVASYRADQRVERLLRGR